MSKEKEFEYEYNPIKEQVGNKAAERVIWTTSVIEKALEGIQQGQPLKASPFLNKNTKLLKPELVRKYTPEEIEDYKHCALDPLYFASKCFLMTPEGLQACKLRDYQEDYIRHLQKNRFSIFLSCRQSGKSLNMLSNIFIKIEKNNKDICQHFRKIDYYYINNDIYELPIFELYNLYCEQTFIWKCKYHLYKIIYKFSNVRNKRNENQEKT